jgi:hypothetical protein
MELVKVITRGRADVLIDGRGGATGGIDGRSRFLRCAAEWKTKGYGLDGLQPTRRRKVIRMALV